MDKQQEFALRTVEERDVRFIRLWFTDVLGTLKSVAIAPAELEAAFEEGIGFDGSAIEGMTRVSEDDMIVKPDPSTFQILPWRGGPQGTARMFCDILSPEGEASLADPRHVLKRALSKAKEKGFTFYVHPEIEFYLFEKQDDWSRTPVPIDEGGYFDHVPRSPGMDFRRATVNMLEQMGISVEYSHHEAGPGQNEIDLRYADALTIADNIMTFRTVVKEISLERGIHASFMPKPLADAPGSGMHTHLSLFEGDTNAFYEAGQEFNMSITARQFAAGILHHAAEICAVTDQFVNSYKRLWGGNEAPSYICWGHNNRSALLRIPQYKPGKGNSARIPQGTARMFCDILSPEGEASLADPRHVLKRALSKAKEKGFTFYVHPEIEFYLFEKQDDWSRTPVPIDEGGYFDHVPRSPGMDFRRATVNMLEQMGISVEYSHHEAGPGQNEIDLRYADALTIADNIMTFRTVVKEISLERGIHASFMPKPLADAPGSGMHTHLSLFEGDTNAFYEAGQEFNMSITARQFAAGILHHAAEICAVTDQFVNSYKRLWGGNEAPSYICWGHNNRSALLRIPQYKPGKGNSARIEFRALDPGANPYLAYSVLLAAGLDGIEKKMQLGEPTSDDVWELTDAERQAMGIQPLPESLDEALRIMEKSDFVADVLGEHVFEYFIRNKRKEWEEYRSQVTPFELRKYLAKL